MTLTLGQAVKRRLRLIPILIALGVRGTVLHGEPFDARGVPFLVASSFLVGAVVLAVLLVWRRPWNDLAYAVGATATAGPYLLYVGWVMTWTEWRGVVVATMVDLTLIAYLVATSWGRTPTKHTP